VKEGVINSLQLWTIHGQSYDLTNFVKRHPGGVEAILLGQGRDCTALFESYHPFTNKHRQVLQSYRIIATNTNSNNNNDNNSSTGISNNLKTDEFYDILKLRAKKAFLHAGIDPNTHRGATHGRALYYITVVILVCISCKYHIKGNLIGSLSFALFGWWMGALGHDAGHFAVSHSNPAINELCVWGMSLLCNPVMWQHQHTYAHHSHTNHIDHDPDLHHFTKLLRVHRRFTLESNSLYMYQRNPIYVIFAYTLVVFGTCLWIPLNFVLEQSLYGMADFTDGKRSKFRQLVAALHGFFYLGVVFLAPIISCINTVENKTITSLRLAFMHGLCCAVLHIATSGLMFAFFFTNKPLE